MAKFLFWVFSLFLFLNPCACFAEQSSEHTPKKHGVTEEEKAGWPKTVHEAVPGILEKMSEDDKTLIKETPKEDLFKFHHGLGTSIRNQLGLWKGNDDLLKSACNNEICHPDTASMVILEQVWKTLNNKSVFKNGEVKAP